MSFSSYLSVTIILSFCQSNSLRHFPFPFLFLSMYFTLPLSESIIVSFFLFISPCLFQSIYVSLSFSFPFLCSLSPSVPHYLSVHLFLSVFPFIFFFLSLSLAVLLSLSLSLSLSLATLLSLSLFPSNNDRKCRNVKMNYADSFMSKQ
jgi:hypothetical protein